MLAGTGSEVSLCVKAAEELKKVAVSLSALALVCRVLVPFCLLFPGQHCNARGEHALLGVLREAGDEEKGREGFSPHVIA